MNLRTTAGRVSSGSACRFGRKIFGKRWFAPPIPGRPDQTRFMDMPGFDVPAASEYAATTPDLLTWFKGYNPRHPEGESIFPFGFLQTKLRTEMASFVREWSLLAKI
jgi:hypothetical protein